MTAYYYVTFARIVDARLQGERVRALPRVLARPFEIRRGQWLSAQQLADRLDDLGYAQRETPGQPGEFSRGDDAVTLIARGGDFAGRRLLVQIAPQARGLPAPIGPDGKPVPTLAVSRIDVDGAAAVDRVELDRPLLTTLITTSREKRRRVSLSLIPKQMVQSVLAIEDRRFYDHPGIDPIRIVGAIVTNMRGDRPYLVGGSTLTQQLVKNFFLTPEKSYRRKLQEQFLSVVLETRATKDDILELYLNDVYLGQRGSYAIHGVAEASRVFFGKDVTNVSLAEAATIAGVIQAPGRHSPFSSPTRSRDRRNVVLQAMADAGYVSQAAAERAGREPMHTVARSMETEAAYFVDLVGQQLADQYPDLLTGTRSVDISTTLDAGLQRIAQEAVQTGAAAIDAQLARKKVQGRAQIALVALDPRTGDILAYIGGRSYGQSQFNRPLNARRQPGSVFKPFVYLAAFESAAEDGLTDITPATLVNDEQSTFDFENQGWTPRNYEDEYDGIITLRRALAQSRNVATVRVAELAGFGRVADLWKRFGSSMVPKPYPSIALGVFEATPMEVASAYTIFPNGGELRPLRAIAKLESGGADLPLTAAAPARIARAGHDVPRHQHAAKRGQRRHGGRGPRDGLQPRRGGQDRHDQRPSRCLVRRLHARSAHGRVGRIRRQPAGHPQRIAGRPPHLDPLHDGRPLGAAERGLRAAARDRVRRHRSRHRHTRAARVPKSPQRGLHRGNRAHRGVRAAQVLIAAWRCASVISSQ